MAPGLRQGRLKVLNGGGHLWIDPLTKENTGSADKVLSAIINLLNHYSKVQHQGKHCLSTDYIGTEKTFS
ncbi:hypothetical protein KU386_24000, partial [Salmonella enterica subsp. enterica serovar Kentucky]|nr:hypothetical protein [Salmonella enterica subsp. enterica serovar Kentucky]